MHNEFNPGFRPTYADKTEEDFIHKHTPALLRANFCLCVLASDHINLMLRIESAETRLLSRDIKVPIGCFPTECKRGLCVVPQRSSLSIVSYAQKQRGEPGRQHVPRGPT